MRISFLIFITLSCLISCGQQGNKGKGIKNSLSTPSFEVLNKNRVPLNSENECSYDNQVSTLGMGLVIVPSNFEIYNDSALSNRYSNWDMYEDEANINVCSKFFKPDYRIMHFVCIGITSKAYKVLINYSDVKYLPKAKNYEFKTWEQYILQSFGLRRLNSNNDDNLESASFRKDPSLNSDTLEIPKGFEMFCPLEIKGDWLKVTYDCFYNNENNKYEGEPCQNYILKCEKPLTGWIKWKEKNNLKIEIFLMP
jgi:hypothetical protein